MTEQATNKNLKAWLGLVMGKALWIECTKMSMLEQAWSQIVRRLSLVGKLSIEIPKQSPPIPTQTNSASMTAPTASSEIVPLLNKILMEIGDLRKEVAELKQQVKTLNG